MIRVPVDARSIQAAIDAASDADRILVSAGSYVESPSFRRKTVVLESEAGPDAPLIENNIVRGNGPAFGNGPADAGVGAK